MFIFNESGGGCQGQALGQGFHLIGGEGGILLHAQGHIDPQLLIVGQGPVGGALFGGVPRLGFPKYTVATAFSPAAVFFTTR